MEDLLKILHDADTKIRIDEPDEDDYTALSEASCAGHVSRGLQLQSLWRIPAAAAS